MRLLGLFGKSLRESPTLAIENKVAMVTEASIRRARTKGIQREASAEHFNRGSHLQTEGKLDEAIAEYDEAIRLNPELASPYARRGRVYLTQGKLERAIEDLDEATVFNPGDGDARRNTGKLPIKEKA